MGPAAWNDIEVADLVHFAQVRIRNPHSQRHAALGIELEPPALVERDLIRMVVRDRTFGLISNQECTVRQFDQGPHTMEAGGNGREFHVGPSGQIEVAVPVTQGKAARFLAKSEEQPGSIRAGTDGFDNILAVPVELKVDVCCRDRPLTQRQARLILNPEFEKQLRDRQLLRICGLAAGRQ